MLCSRTPLTSCSCFLIAKRYTQDHEAVFFDDSTSTGTITVTDYAQSSLGDVVFVELPSVGTEVKQGGMYSAPLHLHVSHDFNGVDQIGAVESVKAASDIVCNKPNVLPARLAQRYASSMHPSLVP